MIPDGNFEDTHPEEEEDDEERLTSSSHTVSTAFVSGARIYLGLLIVFGSLGNLACLIVYYRSRLLKRFRSTAYLKALAISDLSFLLCLGLVWLKSIDVHWQDFPVVCPISIYLSNTSSFLSAWYVMAMTAEMASTVRRARFRAGTGGGIRLIIATGRGKRKFSTMTRLSFIAGLAFLINGWTLAVTESVPIDAGPDDASGDHSGNASSSSYWTCAYECRIAMDSEEVYRTFNILDTVFSFTVPLIVTVLLNCYIAYVIVAAARYRGQPTQDDPTFDASTRTTVSTTTFTSVLNVSASITRGGRRVAWRPSRKETTMASLLAARSLAYILLNLPNYVHRLQATWQSSMSRSAETSQTSGDVTERDSGAQVQTDDAWQIIAYLLFYTQFALNFVIYSGRVCFRAAIKRKR